MLSSQSRMKYQPRFSSNTPVLTNPVHQHESRSLNSAQDSLSVFPETWKVGKDTLKLLPFAQWPPNVQKAFSKIPGVIAPSIFQEARNIKLSGIVEEKTDFTLFSAAGLILHSNLLDYKRLGQKISDICQLHSKKGKPGSFTDYQTVMKHCEQAITADKVEKFIALFNMTPTTENKKAASSYLSTQLADHVLKTHMGIKGEPGNKAFVQAKIREEALELSEHVGHQEQIKQSVDSLLKSSKSK